MAIVAGIDEAGYGPMLGPLVLAAVAFRVPDDQVNADLWKSLAKAVTGKTTRRGEKLVVTDSKKAYSRKTGIGVLEETVLSFAALSGQLARSMPQLMTAWAGRDHDPSFAYPWYADQDVEIPVSGRALGAAAKAQRLRKVLDDAHVEFLGARVRPVFEADLNRQFTETDNKSQVLFANAGTLLARLRKRYADEHLVVTVDKQGGRDRYGPLLAKRFPGSRFIIHAQGRDRSHYEIKGDGKPFHVLFVMKGELHSLPVALASMHAKYVRELFMMRFARFWQTQAPDVEPTAGYAQDAQRFLEQIAPVFDALGIEKSMFIRER